ncbi:RNA-binding protein Pasilla-like isoform X2 [Symsagittifera roscoffensis]|uniref:RNA-binding protein Pasilla-like isoform X2 n=1 Tax=Symsagittifera roscoffensis TaxID=84072 RepID=UPI00307B3F17
MLYPAAVATQFQGNSANNTHNFNRFDFLERNHQNKIKGSNHYNHNRSVNNSFVNKNLSSTYRSSPGASSALDIDCMMTAGGTNISVVTASNAATLPYNATSMDNGPTVPLDELSPSSTGAKMESGGHNHQSSMGGMGDDCSVMACVEGGSPSPPQTLTLRLIMQGKEVGSIIGKRGDTIKKFRTESGARINISDGQSIERIVTLTGANECLNKAFAMISYKFEEDMSEGLTADCPKPPVTLRLIVPASQCGSIIGKGGSKIKEIREHTGCTIQVAGDYLPQSTERAVTISGMPEAITNCIMEICKIMAESPPKGQTLPYRPKPISSVVSGSPIIANTHPALSAAAASHPFAAAAAVAAAGGNPNFATGAMHGGVSMGNNFLTSPYGIHPASAAATHSSQFMPNTTQSEDKDETENVSEPNATGSVSGMSNQNDINVLPTPDVDTSTSGPGGQLSNSVPSDHPTFDGCLMLQENQMVPNYDQDIADLAYMQSFELAKIQAAQLSSFYGSFLQPATMMQLGATPLNTFSAAGASLGGGATGHQGGSGSPGVSSAGTHSTQTTQELTIPNDVIGCVIGPHGNRINDISLGIDPSSLTSGAFGASNGCYGNNNASLQAAALALSANPAFASAAAGLSTNQMLQLLNPGFSLAGFAPASANQIATSSNAAFGAFNPSMTMTGSNYGQAQNVAASFAAATQGSNLVNVMRPNFTNLKKARSEAAPY